MAHEVETAFYTATPAWHRVGTVVQNAPTTREALTLAGLDWVVEEHDLHLADDPQPIEISKALVRSTDRKILSVVGSGYRPLQNHEAFQWFDPIVESGMATMEAAGSLKGGRRVWILAKITNGENEVVKNDPVLPYLCLYNGHDGMLASRVMLTPIRVVCWNTATMALGAAEKTHNVVKALHHRNVVAKMDELRDVITVAHQQHVDTIEAFRILAKRQMAEAEMRRFFESVFRGMPEDEIGANAEKELKRRTKIVDRVMEIHDTGMGSDIPGVRGTLWGGVSAVSEFLQHHRGRNDENRLDSVWFGDGARTNRKAVSLAVKMATS